MPVNKCSKDGKPGFKWGDSGACYIYTPGNEESIKAAKKKVLAQALAIGDIGKNDDLLSEEDVEYAIKSLKDLVISVGNYRSRDYPPVKTSGIVVRGGKAQTKGKMARGPMA